jgi:predicted MFS family arabinose efflux permease
VLPLAAAAAAFLAAQGLGRFGFGLVLPAMRDGLGLSTGDMGVLAGLGLTIYIFFSLPAGALAAQYGTRWVVVGGLLGIAGGMLVTGLAHGFVVAAIGQLLVGASGPFAIVPILAFAGRWVRPSFRGRATGLVVAGGGVGLLLAGLLVPLVLAAADDAAWRRAWWWLAGGVLCSAVIAAAFLRDPPVRPARPAAGDAGAPARSLYRSGPVWRLAVTFGLCGVSYIVYGTFFTAHLQAHGLDTATAGRLWSLAGLAATVSGLLGGALADRLSPSTALMLLFAMQAAGMVMLALGEGIGWFTASVLAYGLSLWGFPAAITKACTELVGSRLAPAALGLLTTMFAVGQAAGPIIAGLLADRSGSLGPGLLFGALAAVAGALMAAWTGRDRPPQPVVSAPLAR